MKPLTELQPILFNEPGALPDQMGNFPRFRYMGSKFRLLPWIHDTFQELDFDTAAVANTATRLNDGDFGFLDQITRA